MPSVAVVVCTRNRAARLAALLDALDAQTTKPAEVIVVDDASEPAVAAHAGVRLIRLEARQGPSAARNAGWRSSDATLIAFTDDDCEPSPDWIEQLLLAHRAAPDDVLQGPTLPNARELDLAGPLSRSQQVTSLGPYFQCSNMAYPRTVLEQVGGFQDDWDWGGEDTDLAWRAIAAGAQVRWVPEAVVEHAVVVLSPAEYLRSAPKFENAMRLLADHPALRPEVRWKAIFWKPSHAYVLLALAGLALARRHRIAAVLLAPYLLDLRPRLWGRAELAPVFLAYDLLETASTGRGALRYRTWIV